MKKAIFLSSIILGTTFVTLTSLKMSFKEASKEANAYSDATLPTTINLNYVDDSDIRSYYSSVNGLSGNNLLIQLKNVLSNGQKYYSYPSDKTWNMYEITDRDWDKSPVIDSAGTNYSYNPTTNIISGYQYGAGKSALTDEKKNPYIHALYVDREVDNRMRAWGNHNQTEWGFNREHIWPKAHGFKSDGAGGARGDPMHLWAGDGITNNMHSDDFYGYVDQTKTYTKSTAKASYSGNNLSGISLTIGSGSVFEPQDCDKGDIARACFYMAARYNNLSGTDSTIDTNNPNLVLTNATSGSLGTSTPTTSFNLGVLSDLLEWNKLDPVDDYERKRNDILYRNYTNNRNPFIDFPEWADIAWGDSTKKANPSTDTLRGEQTGIKFSLSENSIKLSPHETTEIIASTNDNQIHNVSWSVEDASVATISSSTTTTGSPLTITGVSDGTTNVNAQITVNEVTYNTKCRITVSSEVSGDEKTVTFGVEDYTSGYSTIGTSGTVLKTVSVDNDVSMSYCGINTKSSASGSAYSYTMYVNNQGYCYSTSCPSGYYPYKIVATIANGASSSALFGATFSSSILSSRNSNVTDKVSEGVNSFTYLNDNYNNKFWNFSSTNYNLRVSNIAVTYKKLVPIVSVSPSSAEGKVGDTINLTATAEQFDGTVSYLWEVDNTKVASISSSDNLATMTLLAEGEAVVNVTASSGLQNASTQVVITSKSQSVGTTMTIDANSLNLNDSYTTAETSSSYQNVNFILSSGSKKMATGSSASNKFSDGGAILFGKLNAYFYNSSSLPNKIKSFKVYSNASASTKVSIGISFSTSPITSWNGTGAYTQTLSTANNVYEVETSYFTNMNYFRIQILNENNAQIQVQIVTDTAPVIQSISVKTAPRKTSYYVGEYFDPTGLCITKNYEDSEGIDVEYSDEPTNFTFDPSLDTLLTTEMNEVVVTYSGFSESILITVQTIEPKDGDYIEYDVTAQGLSNGSDLVDFNLIIDESIVGTIEFSKGTGTNGPKYYSSDTTGRVYYGNTIKISNAENLDNIYQIKFMSSYSSSPMVSDVGTISNNVWNSGVDQYTSSITFTVSSTYRFKKIQIYYYSENDFADEFIEKCKCDSTGNTKPQVDWDSLETKFNLLYSPLKLRAKTASISESSTLSAAMNRYDYIVAKYGTSLYKDYIGRNPTPLTNQYFSLNALESKNSALIIVLSASTILLIGTSYFIFRRKHA